MKRNKEKDSHFRAYIIAESGHEVYGKEETKMISIDLDFVEMKKFISIDDLIKINQLLEDKNSKVIDCKIIKFDCDTCYTIFSIWENKVDSIKELYRIKNEIEVEDFRLEMLKELNKMGKITAKIV